MRPNTVRETVREEALADNPDRSLTRQAAARVDAHAGSQPAWGP